MQIKSFVVLSILVVISSTQCVVIERLAAVQVKIVALRKDIKSGGADFDASRYCGNKCNKCTRCKN